MNDKLRKVWEQKAPQQFSFRKMKYNQTKLNEGSSEKDRSIAEFKKIIGQKKEALMSAERIIKQKDNVIAELYN